MKNVLRTSISEAEYKRAKNSIFLKFGLMLENDPIAYAQEYLGMKNSGCNLNEYLETLDKLQHAGYVRAAGKVRPIVTEAQVIMRSDIQ